MDPISTSSAIFPTLQPIVVRIVNQPANAADYAAWAGFVLSLLLGIFEFWKYANDRSKLKISCRFNQEILKMDYSGRLTKESSGKTFWSVDIANVGTKNIIITSIAFSQHGTKKKSMLINDLSGAIQKYTLAPGDNHSYTIKDELLDPKTIREVYLYDATGSVYKRKIKYKA